METNEIKKLLYLQKPIAQLINKDENGNLTYKTELNNGYCINFYIPSNEACNCDGKYLFEDKMDAKLLNRWIKN